MEHREQASKTRTRTRLKKNENGEGVEGGDDHNVQSDANGQDPTVPPTTDFMLISTTSSADNDGDSDQKCRF